VAARFLSTQALGSLTTLWRFAHDAVAGVGKMGVWLLSASWCGRRRDVRADMLCDPTGRCCGPSLAHVVDISLGGVHCGEVIYRPVLSEHCRLLNGRASTRRGQ